jgi:hypothetical protein
MVGSAIFKGLCVLCVGFCWLVCGGSIVDCGELMVACVVVKKCATFFDLFFGCRRVRQFLGASVPKATAKTQSQGLKGSSGCGEWNSSGSFTAFRMTASTRLPGTARTHCPGQQVHASLGSEGASEFGERVDDGGGPGGELVVAEGAVVGLEDGAQEEGGDAGVFCVAPDFDGFEAL